MTISTSSRARPDYVTSEPLRNAVNVAIALGRPLLIRGEPGTGKTLLAHSIARGLEKKLITWNIKSTTKAQEGLYVYDTVQRLNDSRFGDKDVSDIKHYIKLGKLGQAFASPSRWCSSSTRWTRRTSSSPTTCSTSWMK